MDAISGCSVVWAQQQFCTSQHRSKHIEIFTQNCDRGSDNINSDSFSFTDKDPLYEFNIDTYATHTISDFSIQKSIFTYSYSKYAFNLVCINQQIENLFSIRRAFHTHMMDSMQEPKGFGYLCNIEKSTNTKKKTV